MAGKDDRVRIEIAFEGGQVVAGIVPQTSVDALERALGGEEAVLDLEMDEARYLVALRKVVYVKRHARETAIGFGSG